MTMADAGPVSPTKAPRSEDDDAAFQEWKASRAARPDEHDEPDEPARDDIDARIESALKKRDAEHEAEMAKMRAQVPQTAVPAHGGGPGVDNHMPTWSLAAQEASARGEHDDAAWP
jgi:hypothetical protein